MDSGAVVARIDRTLDALIDLALGTDAPGRHDDAGSRFEIGISDLTGVIEAAETSATHPSIVAIEPLAEDLPPTAKADDAPWAAVAASEEPEVEAPSPPRKPRSESLARLRAEIMPELLEVYREEAQDLLSQLDGALTGSPFPRAPNCCRRSAA